jgi:hypothetical protein
VILVYFSVFDHSSKLIIEYILLGRSNEEGERGGKCSMHSKIFFFFNGALAHIGPWPPLYEVP